MIEVADRCNESCVHCYQVQGQKGEMPADQIFEVLKDLSDAGILFLTISGGEATLRSDLLDIIREARSLGFVITLFTNGLRMTRSLARELAALEVREVQISLYSDQPDKHDWITQVPGSFEKTVAGVRHLVEAGVSVLVKTPLLVTNMKRQEQYEAWIAGLGAVPSVSPDLLPREGGDRAPEALRADANASRSASQRLGLLPEPGSAPPSSVRSKSLCGAGKGVHIEPDGQLRPCSMLEVPLGDARAGGILEQIRENPAAQLMRTVTWGDLPGCGECEIAAWCGRCHAEALAEVGDALRPYPSACARALMRWEHQEAKPSGFNWAARAAVGPFRVVEDGLERFDPSPETVDQAALYREHAWLKAKPSAPVEQARPGQLVQLRRPGRKAKVEKVPE